MSDTITTNSAHLPPPRPRTVARRRSRRAGAPVAVLAALLGLALLAGCSDDSDTTAAQSLTVSDQWVKAVPQGEMTAVFGELVNDSSDDLQVVSASSPAAGRMELHEVVADSAGAMTMQEKDGGFVIPADSTLTLAPGGDHLMLFDLPAPITPGQDITVELTMSDGSTAGFTAQARDFPGADEEYAPGHGGDMPMTSESGA
ncbi:MAG: copper chaperone PCu(A)C [Actinomycetota bacterium]|nr:copper chaperone PCu(A)C [Actinomycetota bacterium]